ncbi:MAG: hypothetical protein ABI954_11115 [Pyrinomonadaceae bacterium]
MDSLKKIKLETQLNVIDRSFFESDPQTGNFTRTFSPPLLDEVLALDHQNIELDQRISEMLVGDSIKKLYVGVLLSDVDKDKARKILESLTNDSTRITVQKSVGFGLVDSSVKILARDFLAQGTIRGDYYAKAEALANWAVAVSMEKRAERQAFDNSSLPKLEDVLEAQDSPAQSRRLRLEIDRLKNGSVAEKFYTAVLLETIDKTESRAVLESLLTENTKVSLLSGDEIDNIPAYQLAESLLNPQSFTQSSEIRDPIARAFKWLSKTFVPEKSENK